MNPGATIKPLASNFSSAVPRVLLGGATSATRPSRSSTSIGALIFAAGSIRCPPLTSKLLSSGRVIEPPPCHPERVLCAKDLCNSAPDTGDVWILRSARQRGIGVDPRASTGLKSPSSSQLPQRTRQNRHPRRHAIVHFIDDDRLRTIRHFCGQFQPPDNRPGVHDDRVALGQLQSRRRHLIARNVILQANLLSGQSFFLN